jgi:hypothetical protein
MQMNNEHNFSKRYEDTMSNLRNRRKSCLLLLFCISSLLLANQVLAQSGSLEGRPLYDALKKFELKGKASVTDLKLKRDRAEMIFTGDFYFMAPVNGRVTGAVFIGQGKFSAAAPPSQFDKDNLKKYLKAEQVSSDFRQAVLRFSDRTFDEIGKQADKSAAPSPDAQKLAAEMEPRLLKETGINISSRILVSMLNGESPGVFLAEFDKGQLNRFCFLLDPQTRIPSFAFGLNSGEKVMLFRYSPESFENDLWIAAYSETECKDNQPTLSSIFDLISPEHYKMDIDIREPQKALITQTRIDFLLAPGGALRAIPMMFNDGITGQENSRQKYSMKVKSAKFREKEESAFADMPFVQEDWEIGLTLLLPKPMSSASIDEEQPTLSVDLHTEGDIIDHTRPGDSIYYPQPNAGWYPRHGYLKRSSFNLIFRHKKGEKISSVGKLSKEAVWPDNANELLTEYAMATPIPFATFSGGLMDREQPSTMRQDKNIIQLDYFAPPGSAHVIKGKDFQAEMTTAVNFFGSTVFGIPYFFTNYRVTLHPYAASNQTFASMVRFPYSIIAAADETALAISKLPRNTAAPPALLQKDAEVRRDFYKVVGSQTATAWWGNAIGWRSYREQWLIDGLPEYVGMIYSKNRTKNSPPTLFINQIKDARLALLEAPATASGKGTGKLAEIGPLLFGKRLKTRSSVNADDLIIKKGALVLRMLHFLLTDPNKPISDDLAFAALVKKYEQLCAGKEAGTEELKAAAEIYFKNSPIEKTMRAIISDPKDPKPKEVNLDWFFDQWVNQTALPSYRMEYTGARTGEKLFLKGTLFQENVPKDWIMPIPVIIRYVDGKQSRTVICAKGTETPISLELPNMPAGVELDPDMWVLSEKTTAIAK